MRNLPFTTVPPGLEFKGDDPPAPPPKMNRRQRRIMGAVLRRVIARHKNDGPRVS